MTRLSEADIQAAGTAIPAVTVERSDDAAPRGTVVIGHLREEARVTELRGYLRDFVRFVPTAISFNGEKVSQERFLDIEGRDNLTAIGTRHEWQEGDLAISGRLYEDRGHTLSVAIDSLSIGNEPANLSGYLKFENGPIDVFKRGFKLCATQVGSTIGVSGRLDCDRFIPTAGRDSLDAETTRLMNRIVLTLESVAVDAVLETPERIAQHARIFRYLVQRRMIDKLGNVKVRVADGSENRLDAIRKRSERGGVKVFFGVAQKQALNQIMQARGHIVVLLSLDRHRYHP